MKIIKYKEKERKMNKKRNFGGVVKSCSWNEKNKRQVWKKNKKRNKKKWNMEKWKDIFNNGWLGSHIEEEHGKMWKELWIAERKWKFARTRMYLNAYCIINWEYF